MKIEDLKDPQLLAEIRNAKTEEELREICELEGLDLSHEALDGLAGG